MKRFALLIGTTVLLTIAADGRTANAVWCKRPDWSRGIAILPPVESPDPCDSPVGGCYKVVPYYRGYLFDPRCVPPEYGTVTSYSPTGRGLGAGELGGRPAPYGTGAYGGFTGASQDESNLLHLGGFGPGGDGSYRPYLQGGDIIDRIRGGR